MSYTTTTVKARDVEQGDLIDLEDVGEPYVSAADAEHYYQYEYARVDVVEVETTECVVVHFDTTSIGFPPDFELTKVVS